MCICTPATELAHSVNLIIRDYECAQEIWQDKAHTIFVGSECMNNEYLDLITVQETSRLLHICRQKVYKAIEDGRIQGFKNDSGKYLIFKSSVANYVETCYNKYNNSFVHSAKGGIERAE